MNVYIFIKDEKIFLSDIVSFYIKNNIVNITFVKSGEKSYVFKSKKEATNTIKMIEHFINRKKSLITK